MLILCFALFESASVLRGGYEFKTFFAARKDGKRPIGTGQLENHAQLAIKAA